MKSVGTRPLAAAEEAWGRMRTGRRLDDLAEILASWPEGVRQIQEFAARGGDGARMLVRALVAEQASLHQR